MAYLDGSKKDPQIIKAICSSFLKNLCDKLADPEYHARRKEQEERIRCVEEGTASYWQPQNQPAILGNTISPMLSNRVRFDNCMTMLQENHKKYLEN